jgi:fatty-acyl-CoA synthase
VNLFALLDGTARRWPDAPAVFAGTQPVSSWAQWRERALRLAGALQRRHAPGTRVALLSENRPEYFDAMFGLWAAGLAAVPVNYKLHAKEVEQIVADAGAALLLASPRLADALALPATPVVAFGTDAWRALVDAPPLPAAADVPPDSLAWLFYTSGTTGRSKGAMLTHRNLLAATVAHLADVESLDERCSQLHAAPLSHGSGMYVLPSVLRGARQVVPPSGQFDPLEFLDLCEVHPGCTAFLAPTMVQRLRVAAESAGRGRPAQLRTIVYGGGPMYVEDLRRSMALFGRDAFVQIYGQGEAPMTITALRRADHASDDDALLGSVGHARSGVEVRVVGADGRELPAGDIGEIVVRGDVVMAGYWNNPQASAYALRDGWLYTGDVGSMDARGTLTLRDRSKDLVISGGSNIYPREVEEALLQHAGVLECSVIGAPDAEWGEVVIAFVVRAAGSTASAAELDAHCLDRIARFKRPKRYRFVESLPKNAYGKVLKRELRAREAGA